MKDNSFRIDLWLYELSVLFKEPVFKINLYYEDFHMGRQLALSIKTDNGFCELKVHRQNKGAIFYLLATEKTVLETILYYAKGYYLKVNRFFNAKRKFYHRVERIVTNLLHSFGQRALIFPNEDLNKLHKAIPAASRMVGIMGFFHHKIDKEKPFLKSGDLSKKDIRRNHLYPLAFGAGVEVGGNMRAVLYSEKRKGFYFIGSTAKYLIETSKLLTGVSLAGLGILLVKPVEAGVVKKAKQRDEEDEDSIYDTLDNVSDFVDVLDDIANTADTVKSLAQMATETKTKCMDFGGCDIPDCSICDIADCSW